ncbi:MAG: hypothetical protein SWI22_15420 [Pseudomonadota bacterium]|nr:hypothetical protein [Pseudomonadota bacterium]
MPSLTLPGRLIWFAHCPKAGGTSVEQLMVATWGEAVGHLHWGWDLWWRRGGWRLADPPNSPQHLTWEDARARLPRPPDAVFAVVRDPAARMASEHRWQRRGRRATKMGRILAFLPFPLWSRLMLAVAARHPHAFDNHFRPQSDFVPEGARVFRLEEGLAPVAAWLAQASGEALLAPLPHAIPTERSGRGRMAPQETALFARVFATDYHRFGYPCPPGAAGDPRRPVLDRLARTLAPLVAALDRRGRL